MSCYFKGWLPWEAKYSEQVGQEGLQGTGRCLLGCTAQDVKPHNGIPGPTGGQRLPHAGTEPPSTVLGRVTGRKAAPGLGTPLGIA